MKAIMYHYIREYNKSTPNFRYLDFYSFKNQLDFFKKEYDFVNKEEWQNFTQYGIMPKKKGKVVLTFDDGLIDHYNYVFNELHKRRLWGIFYITSKPYIEKEILDVHKIHLLCSIYNGKDLLNYTKSIIPNNFLNDENIFLESNKKLIYQNQLNSDEITNFKKILNYYLGNKYKNNIINKICKKFPVLFDSNSFYLTKKQIFEMEDNGMIIGSHTINHTLMKKLDFNLQYKEIVNSFSFLKKICKLDYKTYCHPYGGINSYNDDTIKILNEESVEYSFSVESREINRQDYINNKQTLPRFDCNEFMYGKVS